MNLESIIWIVYVLIGATHLAVYVGFQVKRREFNSEPMEVISVAFVWPLIDVLWLTGRKPR